MNACILQVDFTKCLAVLYLIQLFCTFIIQRPYSSCCIIWPFLIIYYFQTAWYTNIVFQDVYNRNLRETVHVNYDYQHNSAA
jgi:hypothetical protein